MLKKSTPWSAWLTLTTLVTCALVPMVAAFALFFWPPADIELDTVHHGKLVSPPMPLAASDFIHTPKTTEAANTHWQLVKIDLSETCHSQQHLTAADSTDPLKLKHQQIISALGRESHRVTQARICLDQLPIPTKTPSIYQGIVDPNNQLIMVYTSDAEQRGIYQDLKRLLKYNKLG